MINCENNIVNLSKKKVWLKIHNWNWNEKKNNINCEKNVVFLTTKKWKFRKKCCDEKKKNFVAKTILSWKKMKKKIHHCDFTKFWNEICKYIIK